MTFRLGRVWIRVAAALLVSLLVAAGISAGFFGPVESSVYARFMGGEQFGSHRLPMIAEFGTIFLVVLIPALILIAQPLVLIACCAGVAFSYSIIALLILQVFDIALPVTPAFLALVIYSGIIGSFSWSKERSRRTCLETLETSRQQLTDMLVHDLKRRMSSILMGLTVLENDDSNSIVKRKTIVETIRASADRMLLLTGNLLEIRRMESAKIVLRGEWLSLRSLVQESLRDHGGVSNLAGVKLTELEAGEVKMKLDKSLMLRVMANLIWNAVQHAPEKSSIDISYGADGEDHAKISIANRGKALSPEDAERFFNAFEAGNSGPKDSLTASTGLGLTFCRLAIEAHGGTVTLESPWTEEGDGVRAVVRLPRQ